MVLALFFYTFLSGIVDFLKWLWEEILGNSFDILLSAMSLEGIS
jgi:hypothetical protein